MKKMYSWALTFQKNYGLYLKVFINPSSPNSDQQQFSPNDIHTLSWEEVYMRIKN